MSSTRWAAAGLVVAALLTGCQSGEAASEDTSPVTLTPVSGTSLFTVGLTEQAVQRLGITTTSVRAGSAGGLVVPYAAVVYDSDGSTWTYVQKAPGTYVRRPITVRTITGSSAFLTAGPAVGTPVVVVGAPELLGAEYQISGEE